MNRKRIGITPEVWLTLAWDLEKFLVDESGARVHTAAIRKEYLLDFLWALFSPDDRDLINASICRRDIRVRFLVVRKG